jgi:signal transduction histidine kinase/ActR/RegA family two-component response regulator
MSANNNLAVERLARVMAVRHRQFAMRIVVAAVIAGLFFGFTGWIFATIWFGAYVALQLFELRIFGEADASAVLATPLRYRSVLYLLAFNNLLFGAFGFQEAVNGGAWGVVCACLLWAGAIMNSVVVSNGSRSAFIYQAAPLALFYLTAPVFTLVDGGPWIDACAVIMAGALNLMVGITVWGASQKLYEAEQRAREELERKKAEAEAATAAKSAFVAMVSHELRTPISAILAGAAEVEKAAADAGLRSNGVLISDSARMMRTLLNDLLDLSKIEAGRMSVEVIAYDLRSLVLDTIRFWSKETAKNGVRIRLQGAACLPRWVMGDPTRLRQILNNLFSNAIKFTKQGSITLDLGVVPKAEGFAASFRVIDTGPGMTQDQVSRLFTAFEQLGAATARTHGGTGLGLAISRDLALLMGGDLVASSVEGEGATFSLTLPLAVSEAQEPQSADVVPTGMDCDRPLRVLIADDHEFNRRAFTLMLDAASADITAVEDGLKALDALASAAFDVVLMDVNMPGMGGLDVVRHLRATEGPNLAVPVIALTAAGSAEDIAACMNAGMNAFVTKPVEGAELFAAIERVLTPDVDLGVNETDFALSA